MKVIYEVKRKGEKEKGKQKSAGKAAGNGQAVHRDCQLHYSGKKEYRHPVCSYYYYYVINMYH